MLVTDGSPLIAPPGPRRLRRTLRRSRLSVRLAAFSALLVALVTIATFAALSVRVRTTARTLIAEELRRNNRTLVALQSDNRRHLVLAAALIAESPTLNSAIGTSRVELQSGAGLRSDLAATVERVLGRLGEDVGGGALLATDEHGRVFAGFARGSTAPVRGMDLSTLAAVRNALDPSIVTAANEPYLSGLEVGDAFYSVGAAPLIVDGYTIGTIVFGERVDSSLVKTMRRNFDGDVVISAGQLIIASTLPRDQALLSALAPGQTSGRFTLGGEEYMAGVDRLGRTQRGTDLRVTLLQPLTPAVNDLMGALQREFLLYGTLSVLLAALGAAALSRSLLRPLRGFIGFMREGAAREQVDQEFNAADASQEIRVLNTSFNNLMSALGRKRLELEGRGAELSAANDVLTDEIRQRERVEQALRESEAQLRQSQKLEAIGTLAGGIAHDFNNMLTVISGFTQMAVSTLTGDHPAREDLKQVSEAANSAAALTHQLLAFSRKQVLQPRVLDLEDVVRGMEAMLRRLIGSHIALEVVHTGEPARVKADPGQLEQVLLNLAVNARDAMPRGGTLTVSTGHERNASGPERAVLRVRDTGTGMTAAVRDRIFEPFFTTKDVGKGTGLGLSTVYGIVVQSGGTIDVESTVDVGTLISVAFPPAFDLSLEESDSEGDTELPRGTETILLVDDEHAVCEFARRTLEECGYTVIAAHSGVEALTVARTGGHIDVLLTDIIMPQLTGPQLVERFVAKFQAPCIIYMTGYMDDDTMRLELDDDVVLLRKPFTPLELARAVRSTIDLHLAQLSPSDGR